MTVIENIWKILQRYPNLFLIGTGYTLLLSAITVVCASVLGALIAMMRRSRLHIGKVYPLRLIATIYIEIIRGTPMLLQLYFFYFLVPMIVPFLELNDFTSITVACVINSSAYVAEIIRAGIDAVDKGRNPRGHVADALVGMVFQVGFVHGVETEIVEHGIHLAVIGIV